MKILRLIFLGALIISTGRATPDVPAIVKDGFDAYIAKGLPSAFERWMRGSALEGDTTSRLQLVGGLTQIESAYGKIQAYEILGAYSLSARLKRVYTVSYYPKGPVFAFFDLYKTDKDDWVLYMFFFNTKPGEILPRELIDKKQAD